MFILNLFESISSLLYHFIPLVISLLKPFQYACVTEVSQRLKSEGYYNRGILSNILEVVAPPSSAV